MNTRQDVKRVVEDYDNTTYAAFADLLEARVGWYLGPWYAGGAANRAVVEQENEGNGA